MERGSTAPIETERLVLEPWHERYLDDFVRLSSDLEVMRYISPEGAAWSREDTEERLRWQLEHWEEQGFGWRWAMDREGGAFLGFVGLNHVRPDVLELQPGSVELGWWLTPSAWGKGLATEGAAALRDEGFDRVGLERVYARCMPENVASSRVMEKIGMSFERDFTYEDGTATVVYRLDRADWEPAAT